MNNIEDFGVVVVALDILTKDKGVDYSAESGIDYDDDVVLDAELEHKITTGEW